MLQLTSVPILGDFTTYTAMSASGWRIAGTRIITRHPPTAPLGSLVAIALITIFAVVIGGPGPATCAPPVVGIGAVITALTRLVFAWLEIFRPAS
jgi:hypothetical protein